MSFVEINMSGTCWTNWTVEHVIMKKVIHYHKLELLHFKEGIQSFDIGRCYAMVIMAESKVMRVKCVAFCYTANVYKGLQGG